MRFCLSRYFAIKYSEMHLTSYGIMATEASAKQGQEKYVAFYDY